MNPLLKHYILLFAFVPRPDCHRTSTVGSEWLNNWHGDYVTEPLVIDVLTDKTGSGFLAFCWWKTYRSGAEGGCMWKHRNTVIPVYTSFPVSCLQRSPCWFLQHVTLKLLIVCLCASVNNRSPPTSFCVAPFSSVTSSPANWINDRDSPTTHCNFTLNLRGTNSTEHPRIQPFSSLPLMRLFHRSFNLSLFPPLFSRSSRPSTPPTPSSSPFVRIMLIN